MTWLMIGGFAWMLLALVVAVALGRGIRVADERDHTSVLTAEVEENQRAHGRRLAALAPNPRSLSH